LQSGQEECDAESLGGLAIGAFELRPIRAGTKFRRAPENNGSLVFAARVAGIPGDEVERALEVVGLLDAMDRRAAACSHGMQRRAEFARELMIDRELLLLDEPHSALDQDAVELVNGLVGKIAANGGAAILVSHDRAKVAAIADRSVELIDGSLR